MDVVEACRWHCVERARLSGQALALKAARGRSTAASDVTDLLATKLPDTELFVSSISLYFSL